MCPAQLTTLSLGALSGLGSDHPASEVRPHALCPSVPVNNPEDDNVDPRKVEEELQEPMN